MQVELAGWLIEPPEGFDIVGVQFEQLPEEPLRNLWRRQVHAIQCAEKRQQIKSCGLQTRTQVRRDFLRCVASHSIEHPAPTAPGQQACESAGFRWARI